MSAKTYNPSPSLIPYLTGDEFVNLVCGPVGCLAADTLVLTEFGAIPIAEIDRPMRVLSWNEKTCRYQLSWCGGSFPKGRGYLYRVSTPQGEFDAAEAHQLLCADGVYRQVQELQAGDALASYSDTPLQTTEELARQESHADARRLMQTDVDYLGGCAALDRLRGQQFLQATDSARAFVPSQVDVQKSSVCFCQGEDARGGAQLGQTLQRNRTYQFSDPQQTTRSAPQLVNGLEVVEGQISKGFFGHVLGLLQRVQRSLWSYALRLLGRSPSRRLQLLADGSSYKAPYSQSRTNRPILTLTRKHVQEPYYDLQVSETHNYVTVDGAVHHNSTKTTASILKIAYEAKRVKACSDGIRRSRCAVIRNTNAMINDAFLPDFLKWYPEGDAGTFQRTERKFTMRFDDVECEVLFRGLDDPADQRRLLSTQLSFGLMDEFVQIHPDIFEALTGRLGRYPDKTMNGVGCCDDHGKLIRKVWGASNPPDSDTWWAEYLDNPPTNALVVRQPSGLSPEADWVQYLPSDYYDNLCTGKSEDWIDVYVHGKFGKSLSGQPVFRCFDSETHIAKNPVNLLSTTLIVGVDAGLNPSAVIGQVAYDGRLIVHDAITGDEGGMGALRFIRERFKPLLANKFKGLAVLVIIDPAAFQRAQTDERSVADIFKAEGFTVKPARTNAVAARLAACESYMTRTTDGKPMLMLSQDAQLLAKALRGKYRYKVNTKGDRDDKPEKSHPWSDIADAFQYVCLHADGGSIFGSLQGSTAREVTASSYAWT